MASRMTFAFSIPVLLLPLLLFMCQGLQPFSLAQTDDQPSFTPTFISNICSPYTVQSNGYNVNLAALLTSLHLHSSSSRYYLNSTGNTSLDTVYAVFQCRGDLTLLQCSQCVSFAINTSAQKCPRAFKSRIDIDLCSLIYKNETITNDFGDQVVFKKTNRNNNTDAVFLLNRDDVLATVSKAAPYHGGYYASYAGKSISEGVYAVAQCYGYLSPPECLQCLSLVSNVDRIVGNHAGARVYYGSCYYRFETYLFYAKTPAPASSPLQSAPPNSRTGERENKAILIGAIVGWSLLVLVVCTFWRFLKRKKSNDSQKETRAALRRQQSIELQPDLQHQIRLFSLEQLKMATGSFHDENKLGEGGFGSVYKGTLEDGQCVAIKKLSNPGHRGERQFLSEVKLLTNVQHRNLIKLLGCCVEDSQRLLIYEYIRNQSLDKHLFDVHGSTSLNWSTRRNIIIGTTKGLAYLHEDSQERIVHRDIKAANILLDENFHPKIADFGLARLFDLDKTHFGTSVSVAGTLGYLAPEYAIHGQLTEKADIFSYGIVVLEILSGRRNIDNHLPPEQQRLLQWTWRLYQERRQLELMDPRLRDNYFVEEAIRMVHVALLCTQAVAGLRPAMSKVVALLMGRSEILEIPTSPAFLIGSIDEVGLDSANDDQHRLQTSRPLNVPPPSDSPSPSDPGSDTYSLYAPLVGSRSLSGATSISDVPEPR